MIEIIESESSLEFVAPKLPCGEGLLQGKFQQDDGTLQNHIGWRDDVLSRKIDRMWLVLWPHFVRCAVRGFLSKPTVMKRDTMFHISGTCHLGCM